VAFFTGTGEDLDPVTGNDAWVPPTDRGEEKVPLLIDPLHHEPDLVHVGVEHHREIPVSTARGDEVPQGVGPYLIDVRGDEVCYPFPRLVLKTGYAKRV